MKFARPAVRANPENAVVPPPRARGGPGAGRYIKYTAGTRRPQRTGRTGVPGRQGSHVVSLRVAMVNAW